MREETLDRILEQVHRARNLDFTGYRRSMLHRRVESRLAAVGEVEADRYADRLGADPGEVDRLIDAVAVNVSEFFRDPLVFGLIEEAVLPSLFARACLAPAEGIRVWCAGCASGEEAYSIAIILHRALAAAAARMHVGVIATDIDGEALAAARTATYQPDRLRFVRPELLDRYFARQGGRYAVSAEVREMVRFSRDDLASASTATPRDSVYGCFHLVLCRNVLIYQSRALQNRVLDKLCAAVATGGFLVLGGSELLLGPAESRFQEIRAGSRVYARKEPG